MKITELREWQAQNVMLWFADFKGMHVRPITVSEIKVKVVHFRDAIARHAQITLPVVGAGEYEQCNQVYRTANEARVALTGQIAAQMSGLATALSCLEDRIARAKERLAERRQETRQ
jgi:hypothetical protein